MSVLVVDDATIMRIVLKDILEKFCEYPKNDIYEAAGGEQAIVQYKRHRPELVFLDIGMPDKSGTEVVKELIEIDPDAKIVMCTASKDRADVVECVNFGAIDYIVKPLNTERVMQIVSKITGKTFDDEANKSGSNGSGSNKNGSNESQVKYEHEKPEGKA